MPVGFSKQLLVLYGREVLARAGMVHSFHVSYGKQAHHGIVCIPSRPIFECNAVHTGLQIKSCRHICVSLSASEDQQLHDHGYSHSTCPRPHVLPFTCGTDLVCLPFHPSSPIQQPCDPQLGAFREERAALLHPLSHPDDDTCTMVLAAAEKAARQ